MFGKTGKKMETIIGEGTEVKGELDVKGTIRVDGAIEGRIRADWVIVGESGKIRGNVASRGMIVGGDVEGNIDADEIVELKPRARVSGEIRSRKLAVSEGAVFDGRCRMKESTESGEGSEAQVISLKAQSPH